MSLALAHFASSQMHMYRSNFPTVFKNCFFFNIQNFEHQLGTRNFKQYELSAYKIVKKIAKITKFLIYVCPSLVKILARQESYWEAMRKKAANNSDFKKFACLWKIVLGGWLPQSQKDWYGKCVVVAIVWPERGLAFDQVLIHRVMLGAVYSTW